MKRLLWPLAVVIVPAILGAAGLLVAHAAPLAPTAPPDTIATLRPTASPSPAPTTTTASGTPRATATPRQAARPRPPLTDPWAVVSAYYRDIDAHKYAQAWALISPALATYQTYQQFVAGYACTGTEQPTKLGQSGHQVSFNLTVLNDCTGTAQYYTGTDTVRGGKIVAADVTRTG
jgi:hypothetical protein